MGRCTFTISSSFAHIHAKWTEKDGLRHGWLEATVLSDSDRYTQAFFYLHGEQQFLEVFKGNVPYFFGTEDEELTVVTTKKMTENNVQSKFSVIYHGLIPLENIDLCHFFASANLHFDQIAGDPDFLDQMDEDIITNEYEFYCVCDEEHIHFYGV